MCIREEFLVVYLDGDCIVQSPFLLTAFDVSCHGCEWKEVRFEQVEHGLT